MPKPLAPPKPAVNWQMGARLLAWSVILAGLAWGGREVNSFLLRDPRFRFTCGGDEQNCASLEIRGAVYASRARIQHERLPCGPPPRRVRRRVAAGRRERRVGNPPEVEGMIRFAVEKFGRVDYSRN